MSIKDIKVIYYFSLVWIVASVASLMDMLIEIFPNKGPRSGFSDLLMIIVSVVGFFLSRYFYPQKLRQILCIVALGMATYYLIFLMFPTVFVAQMIARVIALGTGLIAFYLAHQVRRSFQSP